MNFNTNRPKEIIDPNKVYVGTKTFERVGDNIKITDVAAKFDYQVPIISVMNVMEFKFSKKIFQRFQDRLNSGGKVLIDFDSSRIAFLNKTLDSEKYFLKTEFSMDKIEESLEENNNNTNIFLEKEKLVRDSYGLNSFKNKD